MASRLCPSCFGAHIALDAVCCANCQQLKAQRAAWREPTAEEKKKIGRRRPEPRGDLGSPPTEMEQAAIDAALKRDR